MKGEPEAPGGGGDDFYLKIPGGGVSQAGGGGGGEGPAGCLRGIGGGGGLNLRKRRHCTGSKSPKPGKEDFGVKKLPFPIASEKGALSRKIPIFLVEPCREMGIFRPKAPFSEAMGNGSFLTPKPSFPGFGDFDPCTVPALSQA